MTLLRRLARRIALPLLTTIISGCATLPVAVSPSSSPLAPGVRGTIPTYGSNCQFYLLGLIPVTQSIDTQAALKQAKENAKVDVLTDITVDFGGGYFILFSNNCVRVQGLGVPRVSAPQT
jgi:hypothetical protein